MNADVSVQVEERIQRVDIRQSKVPNGDMRHKRCEYCDLVRNFPGQLLFVPFSLRCVVLFLAILIVHIRNPTCSLSYTLTSDHSLYKQGLS